MGQNMQMAEEIRNRQDAILKDWMAYQVSSLTLRRDLVKESELRESSRQFLELFSEALATSDDTSSPHWKPVKDNLGEISQKRAVQGFSPSETATFVFSLKQPLFDLAQQRVGARRQAVGRDPVGPHDDPGQAGPVYGRSLSGEPRGSDPPAAAGTAWSCPRPSSSCGTRCWRFR